MSKNPSKQVLVLTPFDLSALRVRLRKLFPAVFANSVRSYLFEGAFFMSKKLVEYELINVNWIV